MTDSFVLDTNIVDFILDVRPDLPPTMRLLATASRARFRVSYTQIDELTARGEDDRRRRLVGLLASLPADRVPIAVPLWDDARWEETLWANDSSVTAYDSLTGGDVENTADALITVTASLLGAVFVSEDRGALGRAIENGVPAMSALEFVDWVTAAAANM